MVVSLILTMLAVAQPSGQQVDIIAVFLGPIPSSEGFVAAVPRLDDSYRDLSEEFKRNRSFQQVIRLVPTPEEADVLVEVTDRGLTDSGARTRPLVPPAAQRLLARASRCFANSCSLALPSKAPTIDLRSTVRRACGGLHSATRARMFFSRSWTG